jgi:DNA-binding YbaB/EbfC family protein
MLGGNLNFKNLMESAKDMMDKTQEKLSKVKETGESGAGLVKITMTAKHDVTDVQLDSELLKEDKTVIEDLIKAALNDVNRKIEKVTQDNMMSIGNMLGGNPQNEDDKM